MSAWSCGWRIVAAGLVILSRTSLPALAIVSLLVVDETPPLRVLLEMLVTLSLLPAVATALLSRAHSLSLMIGPDALRLEGHGAALDIPFGAITSVRAWRAPLPGPGITVTLRGANLPARLGLGLADPSAVVARLARSGLAAARETENAPALVWARERAAFGYGLAHRVGVKFALFALLPAGILFNTHQHIAYGGSLGQYYLLGLRAFAQTFAEYWVTVAIYLLLYASVWRGLAELACFAAACLAPARAAAVRRAAERTLLVLYYAGVPVLVGLRFLI